MLKKISVLCFISIASLHADEISRPTETEEVASLRDQQLLEIEKIRSSMQEKVKAVCGVRIDGKEVKTHLKEFVACEVLTMLLEEYSYGIYRLLSTNDPLSSEISKEFLNIFEVIEKNALSKPQETLIQNNDVDQNIRHTTQGTL